MSPGTCSDCSFWQSCSEDKARGECRRFPPQLLIVELPTKEKPGIADPVWPQTAAHKWCGEWHNPAAE